jgi:hypothetical protein
MSFLPFLTPSFYERYHELRVNFPVNYQAECDAALRQLEAAMEAFNMLFAEALFAAMENVRGLV